MSCKLAKHSHMKLFNQTILITVILLISNNIPGKDLQWITLRNSKNQEIKNLPTTHILRIKDANSLTWSVKELMYQNDTITVHSRYTIDSSAIHTNSEWDNFIYGCDCVDTILNLHVDSISNLSFTFHSRDRHREELKGLHNNAMNYVFLPLLSGIAGIATIIDGDYKLSAVCILVGTGIFLVGKRKGNKLNKISTYNLTNEWEILRIMQKSCGEIIKKS